MRLLVINFLKIKLNYKMDLELLANDDAKSLFNRFSGLLRSCTTDKQKKTLEKKYMKCVGELLERETVAENSSRRKKPSPVKAGDPLNDISRTQRYDRPKGKMTAKEFGALNNRLNEDLELRNQFFANNNKPSNLFQGHLGDNHEQINLFQGRQFNINEFNNIFENIQDHSLRETVDYHDVAPLDFFGGSLNPQPIVEYDGVIIEDTRGLDTSPIGVALSNEKLKEMMKTKPTERKKTKIISQDIEDDMTSFYSRKRDIVTSQLQDSRAYVETNRHLYADGGSFKGGDINELISGVVNRF